MLKLEFFPAGPLGCNCSLAWDPGSLTGVVVDPGGDAGRIRARVAALGFKVEAILQTHAHFDHLGATKELQDLWQCPGYLHEDDFGLLEILDTQTGLIGMDPIPRPHLQPMKHGEVRHGFKVLHTPGHSQGSCCLLGEGERGPVLLAGDTLFQGGVGRTDLWGGSYEQLEASIRRELYVLDDATAVVPGHGPATTIGEEARTNPYVSRR